MPVVAGKHFPYTRAGYRAAERERQRLGLPSLAHLSVSGERGMRSFARGGRAAVYPGMGFKKAQAQIARRQGVSMERAGAILAAATRRASPAAKRRNPNLLRVR